MIAETPAPPSAHVDELLVEATLGAMDAATAAQVRAHLQKCARCRERFAAVQEALAALSISAATSTATAVPKAAPPPALRAHLLAAVDGTRAPVPYPGFAARLSQMFQLSEQQTLAVLHKSADPASWEDQGLIALLHFAAGESLPGTHAGFMRCAPGLRFPRHRHVGEELTLMLSGTLQDEDSGTLYHPGDWIRMAAGSEHAFLIVPPHEGVFALLLQESWPLFTGT